eukprot:SM000028S10152  [mRNA]  locus=s28:616239:616580:- [translate_table: standard]
MEARLLALLPVAAGRCSPRKEVKQVKPFGAKGAVYVDGEWDKLVAHRVIRVFAILGACRLADCVARLLRRACSAPGIEGASCDDVGNEPRPPAERASDDIGAPSVEATIRPDG